MRRYLASYCVLCRYDSLITVASLCKLDSEDKRLVAAIVIIFVDKPALVDFSRSVAGLLVILS